MNKAIDIIKNYESLHDSDLKQIGLQPKLCPANIWTVGWGRALTDPKTSRFLKGEADKAQAYAMYPNLSIEQADAMLAEDYNRFELITKNLLKRNATDHELGAMTSLCYNIGAGGFRDSSVLRYFNRDDKATAAECFKLWVKADGKVLPGLVLRRLSEVHLFLHNEVKLFNKNDLKK